jgi:hypothetical protein
MTLRLEQKAQVQSGGGVCGGVCVCVCFPGDTLICEIWKRGPQKLSAGLTCALHNRTVGIMCDSSLAVDYDCPLVERMLHDSGLL